MSTKFSTELAAIRNEVKAVHRNAQAAQQSSQPAGQKGSPSKKQRLGPSPNDTQAPTDVPVVVNNSEAFKEDLRVICEFFAFEQGYLGSSDEEIWAGLAKQVSFSLFQIHGHSIRCGCA
jgi:hypothetical protein